MLYIGTAGYSYKDWEKIFYPKNTESKLKFYQKYFNVVEINSTFYSLLSEKVISKIKSDIPDKSFKLIFKANRMFTHERKFSSDNIILFKKMLNMFKDNIINLLFQFPYSFKFNKSNLNYLRNLKNLFNEYHLSFEIRHKSFLKEEYINFLKENKITFVNIDQPLISYSINFTNITTFNKFAYFRLHGRNYENWFKQNQPSFMRYNYLYSLDELKELTVKIHNIKNKVENVIIITNNHYKGAAVLNALQIKELMTKKRVEYPPNLKSLWKNKKTLFF